MGPQKSRGLYRVRAGGSNQQRFRSRGPKWPFWHNLWRHFHNPRAAVAA
jgi:hypothetical protein